MTGQRCAGKGRGVIPRATKRYSLSLAELQVRKMVKRDSDREREDEHRRTLRSSRNRTLSWSVRAFRTSKPSCGQASARSAPPLHLSRTSSSGAHLLTQHQRIPHQQLQAIRQHLPLLLGLVLPVGDGRGNRPVAEVGTRGAGGRSVVEEIGSVDGRFRGDFGRRRREGVEGEEIGDAAGGGVLCGSKRRHVSGMAYSGWTTLSMSERQRRLTSTT